MPTPKHRLADVLLGDDGPLRTFVAQRRSDGVSWRRLTRELEDRTGVDVTFETLRSWFPDLTDAATEREAAAS